VSVYLSITPVLGDTIDMMTR